MECADTEHGRTDKEKIAELEKQIELEKAKKPLVIGNYLPLFIIKI